MRMRIATLLFVLALPAAARSQAAPTSTAVKKPVAAAASAMPDTGWSKMLADHFKGIKLTAAQKAKIVAAHKLHHDEMAKLPTGDKADSASKKAMMEHMTAEHADFQKVLSPAQYKTFETNMAKSMGTMDMSGMQHDMKGMDMRGMDMKGMQHDMKDMKPADTTAKKKP